MTAIVPLSRRPYDWIFIAYFIVHIPVTLCCDVQVRRQAEADAAAACGIADR
jgi:hypothetical protein